MNQYEFRNTALAVALSATLLTFSGCGGGGSGGGTSSGGTTGGGTQPITAFNLVGTVNGTIIEAFGDNGSYYRTESIDDGSPEHDFSLALPVGIGFRLVMTTNENGPGDPIRTTLGFPDGNGGTSIVFRSDGLTQEVNIGHIELILEPGPELDSQDSNGDGVVDIPKEITLVDGIEVEGIEGDKSPQDEDGDGIVNVYDTDYEEDPKDSDDDGIPDDSDANPHNDEDGDNKLSDSKDSDGDGYHDDDQDHDGLPDNDSPDDGGVTNGNGYTLLAWNDLGMHCMDSDFSVWSILPPANTFNAQLVRNGQRLTDADGISLTYEATPDLAGSENTTSEGKTNFWDHVHDLFGASPQVNMGLFGYRMASNTPEDMHYKPDHDWFTAEAVPTTPTADNGSFNPYPMVKVVARGVDGTELASARIVTPVSDEMKCVVCHKSTSSTDPGDPATHAEPADGWVMDSDEDIDVRKNVLAKHDEHLGEADFDNALAALGMNPAGLLATVENDGRSILCASCHFTNALPNTGYGEITPLTQAMHAKHADVIDPATMASLESDTTRDSCYLCHPGEKTDCLRGAMGNAKDVQGKHTMECQACHGSMNNVGAEGRDGWLGQPNCQSCHNGGERFESVFETDGSMRDPQDRTFATNADTPAPGTDLYRFSTGHGGLQCEGCHGSTHSVFPSNIANDNVLSLDLQGYAGSISDCTACHTVNGDFIEKCSVEGSTETRLCTPGDFPHGMHPADNVWIDKHSGFVEKNGLESCAYCHGDDFNGTPLSAANTDRTFQIEDDGEKSFARGHEVGCLDCHEAKEIEEWKNK